MNQTKANVPKPETYVEDGFTYKGYVYGHDLDIEPEENCKIFHEIKTPEGKTITMDWSPYSTPTERQFKMWIDLGCPKRIGTGPLNEDDLQRLIEAEEISPEDLEAAVEFYDREVAKK